MSLSYFRHYFTLALVWTYSYPERCNGHLDLLLHHYDIIRLSDINQTQQRRHHKSSSAYKTMVLSFHTLGRDFSLKLRQDMSILSQDFTVEFIDERSQSQQILTDIAYYSGFVDGDQSSSVRSYFTDDGSLHAAIDTNHETYFIEPSWQYLQNSSVASSMIAYRYSDIIFSDTNASGICGASRSDWHNTDNLNASYYSQQRRQRAADICPSTYSDTCSLLFIADHLFYNHVNNASVRNTVHKLIDIAVFADHIYRNSEFTCFNNVGFELRKIKINVRYASKLKYDEFLRNFRRVEKNELSKFCLGHLFTYQEFVDEGVHIHGLGYIGSATGGQGICSGEHNVAWTTFLGGKRLLDLMAKLVTAHGHNWGAPHDPSGISGPCSPDSIHGGAYLMSPFSVSGYSENNAKFSGCSTNAMSKVLSGRSQKCFRAKATQLCGNFVVEGTEQCDSGVGDQCCDVNCRLTPGSFCSPTNYPCCDDNCKMAPASTVCHSATSDDCFFEMHCTGNLQTCPPPVNQNDGKPCQDIGLCLAGNCVSYCTFISLQNCLCDPQDNDGVDACKVCCVIDGKCSPVMVNGSTLEMLDEMPCATGVCVQQHCIYQRSMLAKNWHAVDLTSMSGFLQVLKEAYVVTIVVCLAIIYATVFGILYCVKRRSASKKENTLPVQPPSEASPAGPVAWKPESDAESGSREPHFAQSARLLQEEPHAQPVKASQVAPSAQTPQGTQRGSLRILQQAGRRSLTAGESSQPAPQATKGRPSNQPTETKSPRAQHGSLRILEQVGSHSTNTKTNK